MTPVSRGTSEKNANIPERCPHCGACSWNTIRRTPVAFWATPLPGSNTIEVCGSCGNNRQK
jgi:hypothetical protein